MKALKIFTGIIDADAGGRFHSMGHKREAAALSAQVRQFCREAGKAD